MQVTPYTAARSYAGSAAAVFLAKVASVLEALPDIASLKSGIDFAASALALVGTVGGAWRMRQIARESVRPRFTTPDPKRIGAGDLEYRFWNVGAPCEIVEVDAPDGFSARGLVPGFVIDVDDGKRRDGLAVRIRARKSDPPKRPLRIIVKTAREKRHVVEFRWSVPNGRLVGPA